MQTPSMTENTAQSGSIPQFPGEEFLAHAATQYSEQAETQLAARKLLVVAQGGYPASVKAIVDVNLGDLPELPAGDRDYNRRHEARIKIKAQNAANRVKREELLLQSWTDLYTFYKESTEKTAPVLSRHLREKCDLAKTKGIAGGYFDGPLPTRTSHCGS